MSYLQAYGHPPVLSNAPADNNICAWPEAGGCETLHSHRPSTYSRISTTASRETLLSHRPAAHRCIGATGNRCLKRRVTANRKERRRTLSINNAFQELRSCIPEVPADTKLSKIKTLRLASSYIAHLMGLLAADKAKSPTSFKPQVVTKNEEPTSTDIMESSKMRKTSGRTGWPQYVWALELKREHPS